MSNLNVSVNNTGDSDNIRLINNTNNNPNSSSNHTKKSGNLWPSPLERFRESVNSLRNRSTSFHSSIQNNHTTTLQSTNNALISTADLHAYIHLSNEKSRAELDLFSGLRQAIASFYMELDNRFEWTNNQLIKQKQPIPIDLIINNEANSPTNSSTKDVNNVSQSTTRAIEDELRNQPVYCILNQLKLKVRMQFLTLEREIKIVKQQNKTLVQDLQNYANYSTKNNSNNNEKIESRTVLSFSSAADSLVTAQQYISNSHSENNNNSNNNHNNSNNHTHNHLEFKPSVEALTYSYEEKLKHKQERIEELELILKKQQTGMESIQTQHNLLVSSLQKEMKSIVLSSTKQGSLLSLEQLARKRREIEKLKVEDFTNRIMKDLNIELQNILLKSTKGIKPLEIVKFNNNFHSQKYNTEMKQNPDTFLDDTINTIKNSIQNVIEETEQEELKQQRKKSQFKQKRSSISANLSETMINSTDTNNNNNNNNDSNIISYKNENTISNNNFKNKNTEYKDNFVNYNHNSGSKTDRKTAASVIMGDKLEKKPQIQDILNNVKTRFSSPISSIERPSTAKINNNNNNNHILDSRPLNNSDSYPQRPETAKTNNSNRKSSISYNESNIDLNNSNHNNSVDPDLLSNWKLHEREKSTILQLQNELVELITLIIKEESIRKDEPNKLFISLLKHMKKILLNNKLRSAIETNEYSIQALTANKSNFTVKPNSSNSNNNLNNNPRRRASIDLGIARERSASIVSLENFLNQPQENIINPSNNALHSNNKDDDTLNFTTNHNHNHNHSNNNSNTLPNRRIGSISIMNNHSNLSSLSLCCPSHVLLRLELFYYKIQYLAVIRGVCPVDSTIQIEEKPDKAVNYSYSGRMDQTIDNYQQTMTNWNSKNSEQFKDLDEEIISGFS